MQLKMSFTLITFFILLSFSQKSFAAEKEKIEVGPHSDHSIAVKPNEFEIGAYAGFPALLNLRVGMWNISGSQFALRLSGMYFNKDWSGIDAEIVWAFDQDGSFQQYFGFSGGAWNWSALGDESGDYDFYLSPNYGIILFRFISIQAGILLNIYGTSAPLLPMIKAGLSFRF